LLNILLGCDSLKFVCNISGYSFYEFRPTLLKLFYVNLEKLYLRKRLRFYLAYFTGYSVYYMKCEDEYVGYCVIANGKASRYRFADKDDIIIGPYYICDKFRGKKLSIFMIDTLLNQIGLQYKNAYDYIAKKNIPSIKASERVGFRYMSDATLSRFSRQIRLCDEGCGDYLIYRFSKGA
jgi:RimJ/RimL family protein N-acetyltransferase